MSLSLQYSSVTSDLHVSIVRDPPPKVTLASTCSSIDHHLSGLNILTLTQTHAEANGLVDASPKLTPLHVHYAFMISNHHRSLICQTPWSVLQDGPCLPTITTLSCAITCELSNSPHWPQPSYPKVFQYWLHKASSTVFRHNA
jgi:hypothetical protein